MEYCDMAELATLERINKEIEFYDILIALYEAGNHEKALELCKKHKAMLEKTVAEK